MTYFFYRLNYFRLLAVHENRTPNSKATGNSREYFALQSQIFGTTRNQHNICKIFENIDSVINIYRPLNETHDFCCCFKLPRDNNFCCKKVDVFTRNIAEISHKKKLFFWETKTDRLFCEINFYLGCTVAKLNLNVLLYLIRKLFVGCAVVDSNLYAGPQPGVQRQQPP